MAEEYVLISGNGFTSGRSRKYHDPHPDNPDRPACRYGDRQDANWRRTDPASLTQSNYCKYCSGEASVGGKTGQSLAAQLHEQAQREGSIDV